MSYRTIILPQALKMLKAIADRRVREKIRLGLMYWWWIEFIVEMVYNL